MKTKAKHAVRGAKNETAPGANRGGGTTGENVLRGNRTANKTTAPAVTVRLVLRALASVLWTEGNEIQQVRRNRHLLLESFDVDSGPYAPYLVAKEVPAADRNNVHGFKGDFVWDDYELERRVVKEIAAKRAWAALPKRERRRIIAESEAAWAARRAA